nr:P-II family nitrogen regulator [uncultured Oscillibacter sp.]
MDSAVLMIVITDRSRGGEFAAWFQSQGAALVLSALGQGTAATEVLDYLGLEATEKAVLLLAAPRSGRIVRRAARELWLDVPGRGILMTVPISSVGGARARDYLLSWQAEEDDDMDRDITHELIVVIANRGHTDQVMDAARSAGAAGGTTIHAKGTGTELARKFLGVSLAAEKEIVFILAKEADRKPIMKAVMTQAGMSTRAQAVAFSLPVTDLAGLRLLEEDGEP